MAATGGGALTVLVSVVIPCRDEAAQLQRCLEALSIQDLPRDAFEVVVVDGGSTDGSVDVAHAWGARVLQDGAHGPASARNLGVQEARGDIVAFTDADCLPRSDWLTRVLEVFAENPNVDGVAGALRIERDSFLGRFEDDEAVANYRGYITTNVAYRRRVLQVVGGFDPALVCCEDYDLAWRAMDAGHRILNDPRPVVIHAPPEMHDGIFGFLVKEWWYAKSDVPAQARALRRFATRRDAPGSSRAVRSLLPIAADVVHLASVSLAAARRSRRMAATTLGMMLVTSAFHVARDARESDAKREVPARVALHLARRLVRATGTLAGIAELLTSSGRRRLAAPARTRLLPPASATPSARAAA